MFDTIGKSADEGRRKRGAIAVLLTSSMVGVFVGIVVLISARTYTELAPLEADFPEMIELLQREELALVAPAPPALGVPDAPARPAAPAQQAEEEMVAPQLSEVPNDQAAVAPAEVASHGSADDAEPGPPLGVAHGVANGSGTAGGGGGEGEGAAWGAPKIFHHRDLTLLRQVKPVYPKAAKALSLGEQQCKVVVSISQKGVPTNVKITGCPKEFHQSTKRSIFKWRWVAPRQGGVKVNAQTTLMITYRLK